MSLADYSDMEKEIANAPEPHTLAKGTEAKLRIIAVRTGISDKNNAKWYQPVFDCPDDPMVIEFNDFLWDLADKRKLDPKAQARAIDKFKKFAACFKLDYSRPFDWEKDLVGREGWAILGIQHDDQYGDKNTINKYVAGPGSGGLSSDAPSDY